MNQRRGHDEGTIFRREGRLRRDGTRAPGLYVSELIFEGRDGRKIRKTLYGKTRREVQLKLEEAKLSRSQRKLVASGHQTMQGYLQEWLESIRHTIRPSTYLNYELATRWLNRHLGGHRLQQLRSGDIERCYARLQAEGLSGRSVQVAHAVLRPALRRAVQQGLIAFNPADVVKPPRAAKREMKTLSHDQLVTLFEATAEDSFGPLYVLLATSGLRIGEALGLTWSNVDLTDGTVVIQRSVQRITGRGLVVEDKECRE